MIPVGYMAKQIATKPDWLQTNQVTDIYSVSGCISTYFADYIPYWRHNGYGFFDSPTIIQALVTEHHLDLRHTRLFFYEAYEFQYHEDQSAWELYDPEASFTTAVILPTAKVLVGYDVVSFSTGTSPECSPLSCNGLAVGIQVNRHSLLDTFAEAKSRLDQGYFKNSEPGPYRIFAVYTVEAT
jgi:hypothetical protein